MKPHIALPLLFLVFGAKIFAEALPISYYVNKAAYLDAHVQGTEAKVKWMINHFIIDTLMSARAADPLTDYKLYLNFDGADYIYKTPPGYPGSARFIIEAVKPSIYSDPLQKALKKATLATIMGNTNCYVAFLTDGTRWTAYAKQNGNMVTLPQHDLASIQNYLYNAALYGRHESQKRNTMAPTPPDYSHYQPQIDFVTNYVIGNGNTKVKMFLHFFFDEVFDSIKFLYSPSLPTQKLKLQTNDVNFYVNGKFFGEIVTTEEVAFYNFITGDLGNKLRSPEYPDAVFLSDGKHFSYAYYDPDKLWGIGGGSVNCSRQAMKNYLIDIWIS